MTFRTTFRETLSSRQIALIDLPCTKKARRIFAIVSTISIPTSASIIMEASVDPQPRGPDWMPITPKTGSLFHAETHHVFASRTRHHINMGLCRHISLPPPRSGASGQKGHREHDFAHLLSDAHKQSGVVVSFGA